MYYVCMFVVVGMSCLLSVQQNTVLEKSVKNTEFTIFTVICLCFCVSRVVTLHIDMPSLLLPQLLHTVTGKIQTVRDTLRDASFIIIIMFYVQYRIN